ncbi:MAG: neutral zinc metallopeptidase [Rudaea sp.]|uniref:KPN_02809 family neutral zinc metallopeptidase n=1 Tax=Rudaea sp. TaxID=2136325 RepID=UPI0039E37B48
MDWQKGRESDNVVEDDGSGGGGFGGGGGGLQFGGFHIGIGGIILIVVVSLLFGKNPLDILSLLSGGGSMLDSGTQQVAPSQRKQVADSNDPQTKFVSVVLASTEDVWGQYFQASGQNYPRPKLVLYHGRTQTACGVGQEAMGPFYCPGDRQVYLDLDFFHEMDTRFHAQGDFARAYVIAHEVGHHVQNLIGIMDKVEQARRQGQPMDGATGLSVRQELQADCFAGVWANRSQQQLNWLQAGDVDSALNAASSVGDDTLQKQARGYAVPDSFTHGSSAQRQRWFKAGFASGDINSCNTFNTQSL